MITFRTNNEQSTPYVIFLWLDDERISAEHKMKENTPPFGASKVPTKLTPLHMKESLTEMGEDKRLLK